MLFFTSFVLLWHISFFSPPELSSSVHQSVLSEVFPIIFAFKYLCHLRDWKILQFSPNSRWIMYQSLSINLALFCNQILVHFQSFKHKWLVAAACSIFHQTLFSSMWEMFWFWHNYISRKVWAEFELFFFIRLYLTILFKLEEIWMEF